jgi:kynurenine formamidase
MKATPREVEGWTTALSNWGRWGPEDQLGTLNLVTPAEVRRAAGIVSTGQRVSMAMDIQTTPQEGDVWGAPHIFMLKSGDGLSDEHRVRIETWEQNLRCNSSVEYIAMAFHGINITHLDAPAHMFWDGKMYNGYPAELVSTLHAATRLSVTNAFEGVMTRGVLLDIPAVRGCDWLDPGEGVGPEELEAAEARQGVSVEPGDAVFLRTGYQRRKQEMGPFQDYGCPGWDASALPWLRERDVSIVGHDSWGDVTPPAYPEVQLPLHIIGIVTMGLWLIDNCDLEPLAEVAAQLGRHEFCFTLAPLRLERATGSPVNPIAIF